MWDWIIGIMAVAGIGGVVVIALYLVALEMLEAK